MGRILKAKIIGFLANKILTPNHLELVEVTEGRVRDVAVSPNQRRRHRRNDTPKTIGSREIPHVARNVPTVPRQRKRLENPASSKSSGGERTKEKRETRSVGKPSPLFLLHISYPRVREYFIARL